MERIESGISSIIRAPLNPGGETSYWCVLSLQRFVSIRPLITLATSFSFPIFSPSGRSVRDTDRLKRSERLEGLFHASGEFCVARGAREQRFQYFRHTVVYSLAIVWSNWCSKLRRWLLGFWRLRSLQFSQCSNFGGRNFNVHWTSKCHNKIIWKKKQFGRIYFVYESNFKVLLNIFKEY